MSMQSRDPAVRVRAIRDVVERTDASQVPQLVDRLEDEDPAVRFAAIVALEKLIGRRLGFEYGAPAAERALAVQRWRRDLIETADRSAASEASRNLDTEDDGQPSRHRDPGDSERAK